MAAAEIPLNVRFQPDAGFLDRPEHRERASRPATEAWLDNIRNPNTRRAYRNDVQEFMDFACLKTGLQLREVKQTHLVAYVKKLEKTQLSIASVRRKLAALSAFYQHLLNTNAVDTNPVTGVNRPKEGGRQGKTPAISDAEAKALLEAPDAKTLKGKRDQAILAALLYHALRRSEVCALRDQDYGDYRGVKHLAVRGKGSKRRYLPAHPVAITLIERYLLARGQHTDSKRPLFLPMDATRAKAGKPLSSTAIYRNVVMHYAKQIGLCVPGFRPHSLRATGATNALEHGSDLAKVQEWLGHADISTTCLYDKRRTNLQDSPTYRIKY